MSKFSDLQDEFGNPNDPTDLSWFRIETLMRYVMVADFGDVGPDGVVETHNRISAHIAACEVRFPYYSAVFSARGANTIGWLDTTVEQHRLLAFMSITDCPPELDMAIGHEVRAGGGIPVEAPEFVVRSVALANFRLSYSNPDADNPAATHRFSGYRADTEGKLHYRGNTDVAS